MAIKTSREALLEMCTSVDEARKIILRNLETEITRLEGELSGQIEPVQTEFDSHGGIYRWFNKSAHDDKVLHMRTLGGRAISTAQGNLVGWEKVMDDKPTEDDSFYPVWGLNTHNPPESWRQMGGDWYKGAITPVDTLRDLQDIQDNARNVFLYGFTVKDIRVVHLDRLGQTGYPDAMGGGSSYCPDYNNPYTYWIPDMNHLLLILEKNDQIPCWVNDNGGITVSAGYADDRRWKVEPEEWMRMVGNKVQFFTTFRKDDSKSVYMPEEMWKKQIPSGIYLELFRFGPYDGKTHPEIPPIDLIKIVDQ